MKHSLRDAAVLVLGATIVIGCGSDSINEPADYTLSLTPATLTITQGATGTATVVIGRTNFTDAIHLTMGNAPSGISGSFDPPDPTNASSTLTVSVVGIVEPGTYDLTVNGTASAGNRSTPLTVIVNVKPASGNATRIVAGSAYSCSLNASGQAYCWGRSAFDGTTTQRLVPTPVVGSVTFASLSAGQHLCGLTATGAAYCWGANTYGQLGDGTTTDKLEPTRVVGGLSFAAISAGILHTCGVTTTGVGYCWGVNSGSIGDGTTTDRIVPTPVAGGLTFRQISVGFYYTCGVTTAGQAYCWGGNAYFNYTTRPIPIDLGLTFASVSASWTHTCGLATNGTVYCWGNNQVGQLGDGTTKGRQNLIPVAGGLTFITVSSGNDGYSCGVTTSGSAYCWGLNAYGQLGDGTTANKLVPTVVSGGLTFVSVAASTSPDGAHTCGLTTSGAVYCWGLNDHGQLGDGTTTQQLLPTLVKFP
jgi:alpha-tubulin suppressor-like RCC1 family protein